jgi:hypothetical protein
MDTVPLANLLPGYQATNFLFSFSWHLLSPSCISLVCESPECWTLRRNSFLHRLLNLLPCIVCCYVNKLVSRPTHAGTSTLFMQARLHSLSSCLRVHQFRYQTVSIETNMAAVNSSCFFQVPFSMLTKMSTCLTLPRFISHLLTFFKCSFPPPFCLNVLRLFQVY